MEDDQYRDEYEDYGFEPDVIVICLHCQKGKDWIKKYPDLPTELDDGTVVVYASCD